jgi:hypothetical protein
MDSPDRESQRQSLVSLARDFIALLRSDGNLELELSIAEQRLNASRRRLYDVANVLEGAGLISRTDRSTVKWLGREPHPSPPSRPRQPPTAAREAEIDRLTECVDRALSGLFQSERFRQFGWFSEEDIGSVDPDGTLNLFALQAPPSLTVEIHEEGNHLRQLICRVDTGRIDLVPVNEPARRQTPSHDSSTWAAGCTL